MDSSSVTVTNNNDEEISMCAVCKKTANKLCSACRAVSYCSVEHQKLHWKKEHKQNCRLWTVKQNDVMGRYVIATRDITPGTVIMDEEALVVGPKQDTLPVCLSCYARVYGTYFCSHCYFPMCNETCEKQPIHAENECLIFRKKCAFPKTIDYEKHHPVYECISTIRCLRLRELNPKKWERLITMEPHNELRQQLEALWNRNEVNVVQFLRDVFNVDADPMTLHTIVGYADINSFEIRRDRTKDTPASEITGMFPNICLMAHDCISNTHHSITDGFRMLVRATGLIKKGEMITTTYTHTLEGTLVRRVHLKESKLFDCTCNRCASPTELGTHFSSVVCKNCGDGHLLPSDPLSYNPVWCCTSCDNKVSNRTIEILVDGIKEEIEEAEKVQSVIELLEGVLQKYSGKVLHPNHYLLVSVCHTLSQMYGRVKGWTVTELSLDSLKRKEEICRHLLAVVDVVEPGLSRIRGSTIFELQQALYYRIQKEHIDNNITEDELKDCMLEVLGMLKTAFQIFSFDTPTSLTGRLAKGIPDSITVVKAILKQVCSIEVD